MSAAPQTETSTILSADQRRAVREYREHQRARHELQHLADLQRDQMAVRAYRLWKSGMPVWRVRQVLQYNEREGISRLIQRGEGVLIESGQSSANPE